MADLCFQRLFGDDDRNLVVDCVPSIVHLLHPDVDCGGKVITEAHQQVVSAILVAYLILGLAVKIIGVVRIFFDGGHHLLQETLVGGEVDGDTRLLDCDLYFLVADAPAVVVLCHCLFVFS